MEAQIVDFKNRGMTQDTSISKSSNEFAFENKNIRISIIKDNTLLSVTNEKGPLDLHIDLNGTFLGKATLGDYVVIFTTSSTYDYIYKLFFTNDVLTSELLFQGHLDFDIEHPIEAIGYYESINVQKIYWVDGKNVTRCINIIDQPLTSEETIYTGFDFNPTLESLPSITVEKDYEGKGIFPAGTIQYFISYYNKYSSSTPIIASSGINYITKTDRGAKADEVCTCSFKIKLTNLDTEGFNFIRIYSVIRTSLNGPKEVKIVGDFSITSSTLEVVDTNINETILADTDIYYVGGQYFIASTLDQKDNTVFFGNIEISNNIDSAAIKTITDGWYDSITKISTKITFGHKIVNSTEGSGIYIWDKQINYSGPEIQCFKHNELYRFAIQFMTKTGEWTQAFFIGDKICNAYPYLNSGKYYLPCARFEMGEIPEAFSDFISYRILMAEASYINRNVLAQGVVSPTVFNYKERAANRVFTSSSWMIRPRNCSDIEARHYIPIINEIQNCHYKSLKDAMNNSFVAYNESPENTKYFLVLAATATSSNIGIVSHLLICKCTLNPNTGKYIIDRNTDTYNISDTHAGNYDELLSLLNKFAINCGINVVDKLLPDTKALKSIAKWDSETKGELNGFTRLQGMKIAPFDLETLIPSLLEAEDEHFLFDVGDCPIKNYCLAYKLLDFGPSNSSQERGYFVDEQILSFHSPEIDNISDLVNGINCKARIVGLVPLTANYGDFRLQTSTSGLSTSASIVPDKKFITQNISNVLSPIVSPYIWRDHRWNLDGSIDSSQLGTYKVYLWNKEGSLSGYSFSNEAIDPPYTVPPAELKHKLYGNLFFSNETKYLDDYTPYTGSSDLGSIIPSVYQDDETLTPIYWEGKSKLYSGQLDTLVATLANLSNGYLPEIEEDPNYLEDADHPEYFRFYDPVRIKYRCTPHIVFSLKEYSILPRLSYRDSGEVITEAPWNMYEILTGEEEQEPHDYMKEFAWYSTASPETVYNFAGAYYMESPSEENMIQELRKRESAGLLNLDEDSTYVVTSLYTEESINSIYVYPTSSGTFNAICKGPLHLAATLQFAIYSLDSEESPRELVTVVIPAGDTSPHQICGVGYDIDQTQSPSWNIIKYGNPPKLTDTITHYYEVTISDGVYTSTEIQEPTGTYQLVTGVYEYYILNNLDVPTYLQFVNYKSHGYSSVPSNTVDIQQDILEIDYPQTSPYLFMVELYREANGDQLYGNSLENVTWNPICEALPLDNSMNTSYGDTFYQRWDCLKSYPMTEEDTNSLVDITSFMVESHINLDCRTDINRGTSSLLNARSSNYNLYNTVYNQADNVFQYNILNDKFNNNIFSNQIVWSLPKTPLDNIDTWTQISLNNSLSLDGSYGDVNKIVGINDTLLIFQDSAIASIQYNNRTILSTEQNVPVQIANSNTVDGYIYASKTNGCRNKWSICSTSSGVFFIDDNNKSLLSINKEGLKDISTTSGMSRWFKENTNGIKWNPNNNGFRLNYDAITKDIYIANTDTCLLFNELIGGFTSFMTYEGKPFIFNLKGKSFITSQNPVSIYEMFGGEYNKTFNGDYIDYYMQYNINPEPYTDKVFTNIEYISDVLSSSSDIGDPENLVNTSPFNTLRVWNEYQLGESTLLTKYYPSTLKKKFRVWRAEIPRDQNSQYKLDRIRNPWINLKLIGTPNNTNKMVFHNLIVKYYK